MFCWNFLFAFVYLSMEGGQRRNESNFFFFFKEKANITIIGSLNRGASHQSVQLTGFCWENRERGSASPSLEMACVSSSNPGCLDNQEGAYQPG